MQNCFMLPRGIKCIQLLSFSADQRSLKQDAAYEPECSHVEHFCETNYLNSLQSTFSPATLPVHCRLWNAEEGGVQSQESGV